jgi:hypothetical protein
MDGGQSLKMSSKTPVNRATNKTFGFGHFRTVGSRFSSTIFVPDIVIAINLMAYLRILELWSLKSLGFVTYTVSKKSPARCDFELCSF